jgi:hypothetical protein
VDWEVDNASGAVAHFSAFGERCAKFDVAVGAAEIRLVGDQADRAGLRAGAKQRALGAGKYFDPVHVRDIDIKVPPGLRQRLFIQIERDIRGQPGNARCGQVRRRRCDTADVNRVLSRARAARRNAGQLHKVIVKVGDAHIVERVLTKGLNRNRYVLGARGALGGGDDDFLELRHRRTTGEYAACRGADDSLSDCFTQLVVRMHWNSLGKIVSK